MNAHYTPFSILRTGFSFGTKLIVTIDKKLLPKDLRNKGMLGASVKFQKLIGSQVSVKYMNNNHFLPVEAVLSYKDFTVVSSPIVSDTLFIVVSKHPMFEVGTVFETSLLRDGNRLGFYDNHGRLCVLDDSIRSLSEVVKLNSNKVDVETLSNKFAIKPEQVKKSKPEPEVIGIEGIGLVEVKQEPIVVDTPKPSLMKDGSTVTSKKLLTDFVNVDVTKFDCINETINEIAKDIQAEFTDIQGHVHKNLIECLKANQNHIDLLYLGMVQGSLQAEIDSRK